MAQYITHEDKIYNHISIIGCSQINNFFLYGDIQFYEDMTQLIETSQDKYYVDDLSKFLSHSFQQAVNQRPCTHIKHKWGLGTPSLQRLFCLILRMSLICQSLISKQIKTYSLKTPHCFKTQLRWVPKPSQVMRNLSLQPVSLYKRLHFNPVLHLSASVVKQNSPFCRSHLHPSVYPSTLSIHSASRLYSHWGINNQWYCICGKNC